MSEDLHGSGSERSPISSDLTSFSGRPVHVEAYLEQCSSIEKNIDRRMAAGRFNLSVLTALGAVNGVIISSDTPADAALLVKLQTGSSVLALLVCISWIFQILRFREVSRIKHEVAIELEKEIGVKRVLNESNAFKQSGGFLEQTLSEVLLPLSLSALVIWSIFS